MYVARITCTVVLGLPLHFMLNHGNLDYFSISAFQSIVVKSPYLPIIFQSDEVEPQYLLIIFQSDEVEPQYLPIIFQSDEVEPQYISADCTSS